MGPLLLVGSLEMFSGVEFARRFHLRSTPLHAESRFVRPLAGTLIGLAMTLDTAGDVAQLQRQSQIIGALASHSLASVDFLRLRP